MKFRRTRFIEMEDVFEIYYVAETDIVYIFGYNNYFECDTMFNRTEWENQGGE